MLGCFCCYSNNDLWNIGIDFGCIQIKKIRWNFGFFFNSNALHLKLGLTFFCLPTLERCFSNPAIIINISKLGNGNDTLAVIT